MKPSDTSNVKVYTDSQKLVNDDTAILGSEAFLDAGLTDAECDGTQSHSKIHINAINQRTEEKLKQKNKLDK